MEVFACRKGGAGWEEMLIKFRNTVHWSVCSRKFRVIIVNFIAHHINASLTHRYITLSLHLFGIKRALLLGCFRVSETKQVPTGLVYAN